MTRTIRTLLPLCAALVLFLSLPGLAKADDLLVFAAASLKNALDAVDAAYEAQGGKVRVSYAASGPLAKQIEQAAPADLFISADLQWMDYLDGKHLIRPGSRENFLGNQLVLVAPADSSVKIDIKPGFPLAALIGDGHLAMGDPQSVPAGHYAEAALETLGIWDQVKPKVANAENVRAALALVSRGEAPLGIVYRTDAMADNGTKIVGIFPEDSHPPILYPVAIIAASQNPAAEAYLKFLTSPAAASIFEQQGFKIQPHDAS